MKPILTTYAALQYVSKYASKAEPRSLAFSEVLDKALHNDKPNDSGIKLNMGPKTSMRISESFGFRNIRIETLPETRN